MFMYRLKIEMKNAPSFLGYSKLDAEITAHTIDHREQIDLSTGECSIDIRISHLN